MDKARKRASVYTLGCRLNQAESAIIVEKLIGAGYRLVPFGEPADLGIIHTCTVTNEADTKSRKAIRAFVRKNPRAFVAVVGCYSQLAAEAIAGIGGVDLIVGNRDKLNVLDYVISRKNATPVIVSGPPERGDFTISLQGTSALSRRVNLKIQDGCDCMCSYCVVPFARGGPRSRDMGNLVEAAGRLVARGAKEIVLTGVNVGRYDHKGEGIVDLVDRLDAIEGLARIRISSIELTCVPPPLFERMNDPNHPLVPFLHVPLQSGSDTVLRRMNRPYSAAEFGAFVARACEAVVDLCVGTDLLAGMPGETEQEFEETCRFFEQTPLAYAHVFQYSDRPGAPAARFPDKVNPKVIHARSARLRRISAEKRAAFDARFVGRTLDVLFEQAEHGMWSGYTGNYIRVTVCSNEDLTNCIRPVLLERLDDGRVIGRLGHD